MPSLETVTFLEGGNDASFDVAVKGLRAPPATPFFARRQAQ
jgi:hypothetical protein